MSLHHRERPLLDASQTCLNVGSVCRHVWVVVTPGVLGEGYMGAHDCPRCNPTAIWTWTAIVGGDPKTRAQSVGPSSLEAEIHA